MPQKKVLILLPDGVGLRNFAYSSFHSIGVDLGFAIKYWNNTPFDLKSLGFKSVDIKNSKSHPITDIYKNARKQIELNLFIKRSGDTVYNSYRFPPPFSSLRKASKSILTEALIQVNNSEKGLEKIRTKILDLERKTTYYSDCVITLKRENPAFVFCTNQRPLTAIAPILAARDLNIPTACFIFSWDNLPKATMVVETDYYFVWSEYMKKELLFYYPHLKEEQVFVTGTPQFENHFQNENIKTKQHFYSEYNLDLGKKYICYSGDDITTCPDDPEYLENIAEAIEKLNQSGNSIGIIFRRCPVDFSKRFDIVLEKYKELIVPINPKWDKIGDGWNTILPSPEDLQLQLNTILHSELVVNLGSSMVFDYAVYSKPCAYINYDVSKKVNINWSVSKIYKYVHFRSMPNKEAVVWLNSKEEIAANLELMLDDSKSTIENAKKWFQIVIGFNAKDSSYKIWKAIEKITT